MGKIRQLAWDFALVCAIAAIIAGGLLAFLSWQHSSPMLGMLAVLLVLAGPALAVAVIVARPDAPGKEGEPPQNALVDSLHRTDAAIRIVGLGRAHVGVFASYVVIMWICEAGGMVSLKGLLVFLTFACTVTAVAYLPWLASRERRLYDERAEIRQRLAEIESQAR